MKIYFAHPSFDELQRQFKKTFLDKITSELSKTRYNNDISIIDPFKYAPDVEGSLEIKLEMAEAIKAECIRLLSESDLIIALTDGNDTGTAFEAGYAYAVNKPVILISREDCSTANAMLLGAAKAAVNNILDDEQIARLIGLIKFFYGVWKASRKNPQNN